MDGSTTLMTDTLSSHKVLNGSSRLSAIQELIDTEQRYVNDLRFVADEFIKPLSNGHILSDNEIEKLFSNWFGLIACNSVLLSTLHEQLQHTDYASSMDSDSLIRTSRSASMSNISIVPQVSIKIPIMYFIYIYVYVYLFSVVNSSRYR